jgi:hypothetical protein
MTFDSQTDPDRHAARDYGTMYRQDDGTLIVSWYFLEDDHSIEMVQRGDELVARLQENSLDDD